MIDSDKIKILKLSNNHASTLIVLVKLQNIDPNLLNIIFNLKLSQENIWKLYKYYCKMNINEMITTLYTLDIGDGDVNDMNIINDRIQNLSIEDDKDNHWYDNETEDALMDNIDFECPLIN